MNNNGAFETIMTIPEFAIEELFGGLTPVFTFPGDIPTQPNFQIGFVAPGELAASNRFELLDADAPAILPATESSPVPTNESLTQKPKKSYSARKPRAKFERKNRKPITSGNNNVGKKGKERCALCRKRHWKCVFKSLDSPCELCREVGSEEPCIKTWGPKTSETIKTSRQRVSMFEACRSKSATRKSNPSLYQSGGVRVPFASLDLSRPVTVYDSTIDPMDRHILQKGFEAFAHRSISLVERLLPKLPLVYGLSISHPSLRPAIVLYCCSRWPEVLGSETVAQLGRGACQALGRRLKVPDVLDEGDLFAAYFVAWHFCFPGDDRQLTYAGGFMAVARRLIGAADRSITTSTFRIFWPMLIWDLSEWSTLDVSTLNVPQGALAPSHYEQWCRVLDQPVSVKSSHAFMSCWYFATLKAIYTENRMFAGNDLRTIKDVEPYLNNVDDLYVYWCLDGGIVQYGEQQARWAVGCFSILLHYNFCCLLTSILPPSSDKLNFLIVAKTRVFTFFTRIEDSVDQVEVRLVNEEEVLALPGKDETQEPQDPLLYEVRLRLCHVRWCRTVMLDRLTYFCRLHHDLVRSLLVDVIDKIPIRTSSDGRLGWLTEAFLNHFGWNSHGNRQELRVYKDIVTG